MFCGLSRDLQLAFVMADHARLGEEACGRWKQYQSCQHDILRMVLEHFYIKRGTFLSYLVVPKMADGRVFFVGDACTG